MGCVGSEDGRIGTFDGRLMLWPPILLEQSC